jgi:hypothetical protein
VITPTPTPSPEPECFAYPNSYLRNGGFEEGTRGWTLSQSPSNGPWNFAARSATGVYCYYGSQRSGSCEHSGKTKAGNPGKSEGIMSLQQTDIYIASGTEILVSGYVRPTRGPANSDSAPYTFTLNFDGALVDTYTPTSESAGVSNGSGSGYRLLTNTITVSGDGPHTLSLQVDTKGTSNTFIYDADDFSVTIVSAPANQQLCATSTG